MKGVETFETVWGGFVVGARKDGELSPATRLHHTHWNRGKTVIKTLWGPVCKDHDRIVRLKSKRFRWSCHVERQPKTVNKYGEEPLTRFCHPCDTCGDMTDEGSHLCPLCQHETYEFHPLKLDRVWPHVDDDCGCFDDAVRLLEER